ncbi:MAG: hypothetical protein ABI665_23195 [Vicinamibacterales bacterium]
MPEARILARLHAAVQRLRLQSVLWALAAGGALCAALVVLGLGAIGAAAVSLVFASIIALRAARRWTPVAAALAIEQVDASLENLAVTAAELLDRPHPIRADLRAELLRQAWDRLAAADIGAALPLTRPAVVCAVVMLGCVGVAWGAAQREERKAAWVDGEAGAASGSLSITAMHLRIEPPAYSGRPIERIDNPIQVTALAGSTIQLEVESAAPQLIVEGNAAMGPLVKDGDRFVAQWVADRAVSLSLRPAGAAADGARFVSVLTIPDAAPAVYIRAPGRDLVVTASSPPISVGVEGADDLGLASMVLRFTRASGGGESVTFSEGDVPLSITRHDDRRWTATARWALGGLHLADGDVLVYRAMARDRNPAGKPVQSESFVIEVGQVAGSADGGFAIPSEEKKYAISQQMVIYKTEQLIAGRAGHAADWIDQNRMLAIEQRMVRAEVVFLGGGEVEDEEVEAAASNELTEGRLQNAGRAEMLRAINAMSRAEAQLNDGQAAEALVFERAALKSLELAFDRRRYFLRTLSEKSRIDPARRLTGALGEARSWTREVTTAPVDPMQQRERAAMRDLAEALPATSVDVAKLAARLAAVDAGSADLQKAAVGLATSTRETRRAAIEVAMRTLAGHARARLSSPADVTLPGDALRGRLADELARVPK